MKFYLVLLLPLMGVAACAPVGKQPLPITGTWQLIAATSTEKDSTFSTFNPATRMIKIITPTHFAFFNHDLQMGKDSATATYNAGGGSYTLVDSLYTEHLEYFNAREWEGHTFQFVVSIRRDTLTQQGLEKIESLGIERVIVETYKRVEK
ncbi:MAG: hypothetical protein IT260_16365 [Saprospiraceae bacterium]|nr:hypothetical protein [Saprospiraceae bacterium]